MNTNTWFEKEINELLSEVAKLKTVKEVELVFEKILSPREINDMARRLKIWKMLQEGKSYFDIQDTLGASPGLISKISLGIGFGFRRGQGVQPTPKKVIKKSKKVIKYKGSVPIHRMLG